MATITSTIADFRLYSSSSQLMTFNFNVPAGATNISAQINLHIRCYNAKKITIFDGTEESSQKEIFLLEGSYMDRDCTILHTDRKGFRINAGDTSHTFLVLTGSGTSDYYYLSNIVLQITYTENNHTVTTAVSPAGSGTLSASPTSALSGATITLTATPATGYHFSSYTSSPTVSISNNRFTMPAQNVTVTANFAKTGYTVTCQVSPSGAGTLTASATSGVTMGTQVTLTPTPATGYQFSSWSVSPSSVSISGNKFAMPAQNVTVTAVFTKVSYTINRSVSPTGGGTVTTSASSAVMGTTITVSNSAASGYVFDHYTLNGTTFSGNTFTMPAGTANVVAYFNKLSTATVADKNMTPGVGTIVIINPGDTSFSHQIVVTFRGNSETYNVAAGVRTASVMALAAWASEIPNSTSMTSGSMVLKTLKGGTVIGQVTVATDLVYNVPDTAYFYPSATVTKSVLRTVGGQTYPNVGNIYVQGKCGVTVAMTGAAGVYGSTVTATEIRIIGYEGSDYIKTGTGNITLNSGLLSSAGTLTIQAKVTDSRGRTMIYTLTDTVQAYSEPSATLTVYRCNSAGTRDPEGLYAQYSYQSSYSPVGSNTLTQVLSIDGHTLTVTGASGSGWVLGSTHYTFPILEAHDLYLTLTDAFITKSVSVTIPSQAFLIHFSADGTSVAVGQTATTGSKRFTIAEDMTMYIGSRTLAQYIHDVMGS